MAEIKPLGSEKLKNDEKLQRILELTYYNSSPAKKTSTNIAETIVESSIGGVYGIVREHNEYYVKKGLNESSLEYIGGMFMKNKNKFSSYAEAAKRLNLIVGQEELNEGTKYVLKSKTPQQAPVSAPPIPSEPTDDMSAPSEPSPESSSTDSPELDGLTDEPEFETGDTGSDGGEEEQKRSDYMSEIQKYAGKLGQELRDSKERLESDDIKYVLNMIISAVDLDKLDDSDMNDIADKFDRDEDQSYNEQPSDDMSEPPAPTEDGGEEEVDETMALFDKFVKSSLKFDDDDEEEVDEVDLSKFSDLDDFSEIDEEEIDEDSDLPQAYFGPDFQDFEFKSDSNDEYQGSEEEMDEIVEIDMDEVKDTINKSINDVLSKYYK